MPGYPGGGNRNPRRELWTKDTDLVLRDLVLRSGEVDWTKIAVAIEWDSGTVTPAECRERWAYVKETPVKGPWSSEEDDHLKRLVEQYGAKKWNLLARAFPGRSGKQCRERWHNHVDAHIKKGEWTAEEDQILCEAQRQLGNKWSEMSRILTGRSENAIKNRFNSLNAKGLAETRANELMAKLAPEEKAELMLRDVDRPPHGAVKPAAPKQRVPSKRPSSSSSSSSSSKPFLSRYGESSRARGDSGNARRASSNEHDRFGSGGSGGSGSSGGGGSGSGSSRGRIGREDENASAAMSFYGGGSGGGGGGEGGRVDDDDRHHQYDARVGRSLSSGGGGSEDGVGGGGGGGSGALQALMVAAVAAGEDRAGGGGIDSYEGGGFGGGEDNESDDGDGNDRWGTWAGAGAGGKRGRSPVTDGGGWRRWEGEDGDGRAVPDNRGAKREKGGQARRKPELARAEAGMAVLAQAAGLLDIQDSVEDDGSGSVRSYSDNSSSGESFARPPYGHLLPGSAGFRHHGGGVPDHGSTPPGSASPPPSGGSAGGMTAAAGDGAASFDGSSNGGPAYASAFALGTGETVHTGEHGYGYRDGGSSSSSSSSSGGGAIAGGGGGPPLQRPGWIVGPGGVQQRRSLQSVPGPWRPYWKDSNGEDCVGAPAAALGQHDGTKRGAGNKKEA
eukprot:g10945.t1